jgi:galactose mutarotase-like enzyme
MWTTIERSRTDSPPAEISIRTPDAEAGFTPGDSFWGTSWRLRRGDSWVPIMAEPKDWSAFDTGQRFWGSPILFPYALNVADGRFTWRGKQHSIAFPDGRRTFHGIVRLSPWMFDRAWIDADGAHAQSTFSNTMPVDRLAEWPFPFELTMSYTLFERTYRFDLIVRNTGREPMPFGVGIHPYLTLPFVAGGSIDDLVITSDGDQIVRQPPSGVSATFEPVPAHLDLRRGKPVSALLGNDHDGGGHAMFVTYVDWAKRGFNWQLRDRAAGVTLDVQTSDDFRTMVHWAHRDRGIISPVICTSLSNGVNLQDQGIEAGIKELAPGETWRGWTTMRVTFAGA